MTTKQAAQKWGLSEATVRKYAQEKFVFGANKQGMVWEIPEHNLCPYYFGPSKINNQKKRRKLILKAVYENKTIPLVKLDSDELRAQAILASLFEEGYVKVLKQVDSDDWFYRHELSEKGEAEISPKFFNITKVKLPGLEVEL